MYCPVIGERGTSLVDDVIDLVSNEHRYLEQFVAGTRGAAEVDPEQDARDAAPRGSPLQDRYHLLTSQGDPRYAEPPPPVHLQVYLIRIIPGEQHPLATGRHFDILVHPLVAAVIIQDIRVALAVPFRVAALVGRKGQCREDEGEYGAYKEKRLTRTGKDATPASGEGALQEEQQRGRSNSKSKADMPD